MRPPRTSKRLCLLQPQPQPHSHFSDEPVPLCVLQPPVRRSPRLLSPPAPDASESRRLSLSAASSRTRSPRLDSPMQCNAESKSPLKKATRSSTGKTGSVVLSGGMALSRSPRFGASPGLDLSVLSVESKSALKKVVRCSPWKTGSVVLSGGMALRRSPRFGGSPMLDLSVQSVESKSALKKVTRCSPWKTGSVAFSSGMALRRSPRFCSSASDFGTRRTNVARIAAKGRGSADQSSMPNDGQGKLSKVMKYSKAKFCQKPSILSSVEEKPVVPWHKEHEKAHMNATLDDSRDMEIVELTSSQRLKMTTEDSCCKESARKPSVAVADDKQLKDHARNAAILVDDEHVEVKSIYTDSPDKQPYKKNKPSPMNSDTSVFDDWCLNQCPTDDVLPLKPEDGGFLYTAQTLLDPIGKQTSVETEFSSSVKIRSKQKRATFFIGDPIPEDEARRMWQWRYDLKNQTLRSAKKLPESGDEDEIVMNVKSHYRQAEVGGCIFDVGDCAYIRGEGKQKHVGRILEFFRTTDDEDYFRVQWFYRAEDTVMQEQASFHDKRRLFYSTVQNDNPVKCILSKVTIARLKPKVSVKSAQSLQSNLYYDMEYSLEYSTFSSFISGDDSSHSIDGLPSLDMKNPSENIARCGIPEVELNLNLLDLYSGCGGMSTGLRLGAKLSGINLVTRWALDCDKSACESLKLNYPETEIRNEHAEDFLKLLKEWEKLCRQFPINGFACTNRLRSNDSRVTQSDESFVDVSEGPEGEYEVSNLVDICYGDPNETDKPGLYFKVHWKGYGSHEDTWEPIEGLRNCQERIQEFVRKGFKSKILPLPGDVDVICGGPPCQGISGYNRYRNVEAPLDDTRNRQIVVFMDIVQFLKPKFVLMENVTDILRLDKASLARYALSRLVHMRYQARLGTMAAGCYGLPQFRLRVFLWGAHPEERLPQFPLPTHDVIIRYWPPPEFERNVVGYDEDHTPDIEKHAVLQDAIFDLPSVPNRETREEIPYDKSPETDFQKYIRAAKHEFAGSPLNGCTKMTNSLYDHRPYSVSEDNYSRICQIPKKKGANFRDLPGVIVRADNSVQRDETKEQVLLPSGEPMVSDFALRYLD